MFCETVKGFSQVKVENIRFSALFHQAIHIIHIAEDYQVVQALFCFHKSMLISPSYFLVPHVFGKTFSLGRFFSISFPGTDMNLTSL